MQQRLTQREKIMGHDNQYKLYSKIYSKFYSEHVDTEFLNRVWDPSWKSILEVGVGQGRLIPFFLTHPIEKFVGLDISEDMIARIPSKCLVDSRVACKTHDFLTYETEQKFDLILYTYNTFNYMLTLDEAYQHLRQCSRYLANDGVIFFDMTFPVCLRKGVGSISKAEAIEEYQQYVLKTEHFFRIEDSQERREFQCDIYERRNLVDSLKWQVYRRYYTVEDMISLGRIQSLSPVHLEMYLAKDGHYYDGYFLFLKRNAF